MTDNTWAFIIFSIILICSYIIGYDNGKEQGHREQSDIICFAADKGISKKVYNGEKYIWICSGGPVSIDRTK